MVEVSGELNARQVVVLKWIADGCPDGVMEGFTYKTTAVALQGRRLVTVSKRHGVWSAAVTDAGRFYLAHGRHPDRVAAARAGAGAVRGRWRVEPSGRGTIRARPARSVTVTGGDRAHPASATPPPLDGLTAEPASPLAGAAVPAEAPAGAGAAGPAVKPQGAVDRLIADVVAAGGVLRVQRSRYVLGQRQGGVDYEQLVMSAKRYGKVPPGMRLTTSVLTWPDMEIRLEPPIPGTEVPRRPVPVADRVARYHPVVVQFRERSDRHEVSKALLPRALRLLHALVVEAERRGHTVAVTPDPQAADGRGRWTGSQDGHLVITIDGHRHGLRLLEVGMPSRAQWERTHWYSRTPYSSNAGSGSLRIELTGYGGREGRSYRWTDGKRATLEEKLPDVLVEVEIRAAEDAHRERERRRRQVEEQRRRERAIERATAQLIEADRARHFVDQVDRWTLAARARDYVAAMRATIEARFGAAGDAGGEQHEREIAAARQWLAWAERYVATLDPLAGRLAMPTPPEATAKALQPFLPGHDR